LAVDFDYIVLLAFLDLVVIVGEILPGIRFMHAFLNNQANEFFNIFEILVLSLLLFQPFR
jgi:hypothetical protein